MITVKNVHKSFGDIEVLKGIDLDIQQGAIVAIVGASGAGKTTLLQIMGSLDKPDKGDVYIDGENIHKLSEAELSKFRNQKIGFVFQFHQLLAEFTALENVILPALIAQKSIKEAETRAKELLDFLHVSHRMTHKPAQLSGGEKQRIAIARALINNPLVVFADEPTGNLDTKNREELHLLIGLLRSEFKQTFVIVSHDEKIGKIADHIFHITDGVIVK